MSNLDQYNRRPETERIGDRRASGEGRSVPITTQATVMCGGFLLQFGAAFFTFGMIFWWIFGAQSDVTSWYVFSGDLGVTTGKSLGTHATGISEGGSDSSPGTPINRIDYSYQTPDGRTINDTCYVTGGGYSTGAPVTIEYVKASPGTSRIAGTRKKPMKAWGLFVAIFPGIGLALMVFGLRGNMRALRILKNGRSARGRMVDKQPTNTRINNRVVYKFTFEYEDHNGDTHRVSDKTHHAHLLEDDEAEHLIYDPANPSNGVLVDVLPGKPRIQPDGSIGSASIMAAVLLMLLPVTGPAVHILVGLMIYVL